MKHASTVQRARQTRGGIVAAAIVAALLLPVALIGWVVVATSRHRFTELAAVPHQRVAIVFGAGVRPGGRLSPMLRDRVDAAVELFASGRVESLLMTGDGRSADYDEATAMKNYAVGRGVPAAAILLDYAGLRTFDSCYRARTVFGVEQAVLVTQRYHLPRAVFTCRALGVDAVGYGTPDWGRYSAATLTRYVVREAAAIMGALWDVRKV